MSTPTSTVAAPTGASATQVVNYNAGTEDVQHKAVWLMLAVAGVVLGLFGAVLSTGLVGGPYTVDRLFEFSFFLLANAGFLKAKS